MEAKRGPVEVNITGVSFGWGRPVDDDSSPPERLKRAVIKTVPCEEIAGAQSADFADDVWPSDSSMFICHKPNTSPRTWIMNGQVIYPPGENPAKDTVLCNGDDGGTKPSKHDQYRYLHVMHGVNLTTL